MNIAGQGDGDWNEQGLVGVKLFVNYLRNYFNKGGLGLMEHNKRVAVVEDKFEHVK